MDEEAPFLSSSYPLIISLSYLVGTYGLQALFSLLDGKKDKTNEKKPEQKNTIMHFLVQWHNVNLIVLSVVMFCGIIYGAYEQYLQYGLFRGLICPLDSIQSPVLSGHTAFWMYIFHLSKYYELFDTLLLVIKRKELLMLHVYHHFAMIWVTWSWMVDYFYVGGWWCVLVNSAVHTIMYYYYFRTANGTRVSWKYLLTAGQIVQLFSGFFLVCYWLWIREDQDCTRGYYAGMLSHIVNITLIFQFIWFYINLYVVPKKKEQKRD
jgi:fatty acid elongase 3